MNVLITGATGLVGRNLSKLLTGKGHSVVPLVRGKRQAGLPWWDPAGGKIDLSPCKHLDAVVHLAGENVAGRWTEKRKKNIRDSRVDGTKLLAEALAALRSPPRTFLQASAVGYYGNRGDEMLDEGSDSGSGFLADTCVAWEAAGEAAEMARIRRVRMRIGVVLTPEGGALKRMLPPFRFGLGGPVGSGRQYVPWISLHDVVSAIEFLLTDSAVSGVVNLTAPVPATQKEMAGALGRSLNRPAFLPLPAFVVEKLFGEMGKDLLLSSTRALPKRLMEAGFDFRDSSLDDSMSRILATPPPAAQP
ncbi:MAG: TIGR01777 family protein [Acidobacteria bacterium]|uniref:TIGR01777 family protein n=1 Tax=Candidatus Polarisedimenticola svalbardensis TaxID=2886004 RepID=A0A8J6XW35_9BACT|nr:TIGR01777 family protein [Candidatus Polarisedimenticola svalbardensis]